MNAVGNIKMDSQIRNELPGLLDAMLPAALSLTGNRSDARDLIQQTALKALAGEAQFTPGTNLKAWLYTIMRNEHLTRCRAQKRRWTASIDDVPAALLSLPGDQEAAVELVEMGKAVASIKNEVQRTALELMMTGHSYTSVAERLGCSVSTVKSRLWRARAAVRKAVA